MQPDNSQQLTVDNQSNLLQSTVDPDDRPLPTQSNPPNTFDQVPVGGGTKFQFSEFPEDGQPPKPAKKVVKTIKTKKPVSKKTVQQTPQQEQTKKEEKEEKENDQVQTPTKKNEQAPIQKTPQPNPVDELPIGGKKNMDERPIGGGKVQMDQFPPGEEIKNIDEVPVGHTKFEIPEFAEGQQQPREEAQTDYPMSQKLKSKAIKLRLSGMEDLLTLLTQNPQSPDLSEIDINKLMKETNPACLQKILQCFKAWIEKGREWGQQEAKSAIENGYVNGKPNTKKLTIEICDLMYEEKPEPMERAILVALKGKVAKSIQGYVTVIMELLAIYGIKRMKFLKPYIPEIVRILNTQKNPALKSEAINLLKEAYKWMGKEMVDAFLQQLKENFKKELDTFWEGHDSSVLPKAPKDIVDDTAGGNNVKGGKKMDAYEISDAVDIFKKYNERWTQSVIKAQKWKERVALMQELVNAANVPKIAPSDYRHVQEMIKRLINDANMNVVLMDLKIIGALAKGIRKPFAIFAKTIFSNILSKFREKKTQMIDQTFNTLNDLQYCISIEDVLDDVREGLGDKAPNMKVNLINWIGRFVEKKIEEKGELTDKATDALKALFPVFQKLLSDGTAEVRNCMVTNIAKMKLLVGENFFDKVENKMNKNQAIKVQDTKENIKSKVQRDSKEKPGLEKDLSKSHLSVKESGKMSRTMNLSSKTFEEEEPKRTLTEVGGKVDLTNQIVQLMPKMNDQKYWQKRKEAAEALIGLITDYSPKIVISNVPDLLATLKVRNNDTNKQLIKVFIHLTGLVFSVISEKEAKANAKAFICQLAEGLSDKNQHNRKQMVLTLNRIGEAAGKDYLFTTLSQYLEGNSEARLQIINLILMNEDSLTKHAVKDFPKGITSCLCDKNKDIRNAAERLLQKVVQLVGFEIFRNLASQQRPAFTKDLNSTLDRLQKGGGNNLNNSALMSKGVSPIRTMERRNPPTSASAHKTQKSLSKINRSFQRDIEVTEDVLGGTMRSRNMVQGDDFFAPLKVLTNERIERQEFEQRVPWKTDDLKDNQQEDLREQINSLVKADIANKMLSFDYRKVLVSVLQLLKVCKDINQQGHIREVYDILMKWILVRLWGGNPALFNMIEVLPPVMSILQKKKLVLNDNDVEVVIAIIREYFISAFMNESRVSENLFTITKCLIMLSSGDRVLKKILRQFSLDLGSIHRHLRKEANIFYRDGLSKLIKSQLMEYMGNQDNLQEASKIKQLKTDQEFVGILYRTFHQNILNTFGFKHSSGGPDNDRSMERPSTRADTMAPHPAKVPTMGGSHKNLPQHSRTIEQHSKIEERQHSASKRMSQSRNVHRKQQHPADFDLNSYPAPHPSSPLGKHLGKLLPPNEQVINFFSALFMENGQKISNQLVTHAKVIFGSILKSVTTMLANRSDYAPEKIVTQINLLQQAIKCKNIIKNIGQLLYYATNFALTQLVYEDENKALIHQDLRVRNIDYKIDNFIKVINGVMLRVLENAAPQQVTGILFDLLIKQTRSEYQSQKTIYLIIKCISRVSGSFVNDCRPDHVRDYFIRINEYIGLIDLAIPLEDFNPPNHQKLKPEDNLLKAIKTVIEELCKLYKNGIWGLYDKAMNEGKYPDNHIASFISAQGIPYPERGRNNQNDEMKKINELLSKQKTFTAGIQKLKKYTEFNPDFSPLQYFTSLNYDHKFINMVMSALQGSTPLNQTGNSFTNTSYRKTPTKIDQRGDRSANRHQMPSSEGNIQQKIRKLKMKFQELQPKQEERPPPGSKRNQQENDGQERAMQIKRRIDQMKNKMASGYQRQPR